MYVRLALLTLLALGATAAPAERRHLHRLRVRELRQPVVEQRRAPPASPPTRAVRAPRRWATPPAAARASRSAPPAPPRFTAPSGMTIADFTLTRQLTYRNGAPADGHAPALRDLQARRHRVRRRRPLRERDAQPPQRRRLLVRLPGEQRRRPAQHRLAGELPRPGGLRRPRHDAADRRRLLQRQHRHRVHGRRGRRDLAPAVRRPGRAQRPDAARRLGRGHGPAERRPPPRLRPHHASTPATTAASGAIEILDLSSGGAVAGAEDYAAGARTASGATCSFRLRKACPNVKNETVRPTSLPAGVRTLKVRVIDAAGNATEKGPYQVDVATPSDRGAFNGSGATEDGSLSARFSGSSKSRKTVCYRKRVTVTGRLLNSVGPADLRRRAEGADPRPPLRRALRAALDHEDGLRRRLQGQGARRRVAPRPGRLGLAHPRPEPAGERVRDASTPAPPRRCGRPRASSRSGRRCGCAARSAA